MTATKTKTWTVEEYHRLIEAGILNEGDKLELLDGIIVEKSAQTPPHAATTLFGIGNRTNNLYDVIRILKRLTQIAMDR